MPDRPDQIVVLSYDDYFRAKRIIDNHESRRISRLRRPMNTPKIMFNSLGIFTGLDFSEEATAPREPVARDVYRNLGLGFSRAPPNGSHEEGCACRSCELGGR